MAVVTRSAARRAAALATSNAQPRPEPIPDTTRTTRTATRRKPPRTARTTTRTTRRQTKIQRRLSQQPATPPEPAPLCRKNSKKRNFEDFSPPEDKRPSKRPCQEKSKKRSLEDFSPPEDERPSKRLRRSPEIANTQSTVCPSVPTPQSQSPMALASSRAVSSPSPRTPATPILPHGHYYHDFTNKLVEALEEVARFPGLAAIDRTQPRMTHAAQLSLAKILQAMSDDEESEDDEMEDDGSGLSQDSEPGSSPPLLHPSTPHSASADMVAVREVQGEDSTHIVAALGSGPVWPPHGKDAKRKRASEDQQEAGGLFRSQPLKRRRLAGRR